MQLEDKVLSWLIDSWKMSGTERIKVSLHGIKVPVELLQVHNTNVICYLTDYIHPAKVGICSLPTCNIAKAEGGGPFRKEKNQSGL